jgi:hypothetical protein
MTISCIHPCSLLTTNATDLDLDRILVVLATLLYWCSW